MDLHSTRFYGAKSEPIDSASVTAEVAAGNYAWQLMEVLHGGVRDVYQVVVDKHLDEDILDTEAGAQAYLDNLAAFGEVHGQFPAANARPLRADQSNTSLVVDNKYILKVFRKLEEGLNPDVELLSGIADCPHVAGVRGYVVRDGRTLAMLQDFIAGGHDGFQYALDKGLSDDDCFALGAAIRTVHDALADAFGHEDVPGARIRDMLHSRLSELVKRAEALRDYEDALRALYDTIPDDTVAIQRIHGDLHLGQTLLTEEPRWWYLIDFEGEPARPLEQRRLPDHPLRDVAGMVRSFGYAEAMGGHANVSALLAGYGTTDNPILSSLIADKAAYEVVYEANNRPDWLEIPLGALKSLVGDLA